MPLIKCLGEIAELNPSMRDKILSYRDKYLKKGLTERQAELKAVEEYGRNLHGQLNGIKEKVGAKKDTYIPYNPKPKIEEIERRYAEKSTGTIPSNEQKSEGQKTESGVQESTIGTGQTEPARTPPVPPVEGKAEGAEMPKNDKGILNRLYESKNLSAEAKAKLEAEGLKYKTSSQEEARAVAKGVVKEFGLDEAVLLAEAGKFEGDVNSMIFAEAIDQVARLEEAAKTPEEKLKYAAQWAEYATRYDEAARSKGRFISAIQDFYKKSPLGIVMMENAKRKDDFNDWAKPKEQSWKDFFKDFKETAEFKEAVDEKVKEQLKEERIKSRANRIAKVRSVFAKAKAQFSKGATYSTFIPPHIIETALETMELAYEAGEAVVKIVGDAVDYISQKMGNANWDKDKFRKEWEEKLGKDEPKSKKTVQELSEEKKQKLLDKFRDKLKGLSEKEKDEVIRKSFKKLVESGALEYQDFKDIIAETLGLGKLTDKESARLIELVKEINSVEELGEKAREESRNTKALEDYYKAQVKAGAATRELNTILSTKPNIIKRLTAMLQLNTLGPVSLVVNVAYNVVNHLGIRLPVGIVRTGIDKAIYEIGKKFGKDYSPQTDVFSLQVQKEFFKKLGFGTKEALGQFLTGLNRMDYMQKEIQGQQFRPATSVKDLWEFGKGEIKLTKEQIIDKILQISPPGVTAEIIARALNLGDKPMRFAAEGSQAAAFAKGLGLKGIDYDLFIEFPREEAYRALKQKGLSDAEAAKKADFIRDTIIKEGERSTFQQDNFVNDILNKIFGGKDSGVGGLAKATVISPYIKIPANAYWNYFNIVNPEVAMLQSFIYGAKAYAKRNGKVKFSFDKNESTAAKDITEAKYWLAHAAVGFATRAVIGTLVSAGIFRASNTADDTKKEREGEQNFEQQGTVNVSKLAALMIGENPDKVKDGLLIQIKWLGHFGSVGNTIAKREEEMTPEQKKERDNYWDEMLANLEISSLKELEQGVFGNTSSLLTALDRGGSTLQSWGVNTINMFTNIIHPAAFAQVSKAQMPYYTKTRADSFREELKNAMLTRSSSLRKITGQYPPSKIGIWGDKIEKEGGIVQRLFGFSRASDDNFAQPIYEDYKKTNNPAFFPSAVKPEVTVGGTRHKLNTKEAEDLEIFVGQHRKNLIAPYINNMARFEGSKQLYSDIKSPDEKVKKLSILYEVGYEKGVQDFLKKYPQYNTKLTIEQERKKGKESKENELLRKAAQSKK